MVKDMRVPEDEDVFITNDEENIRVAQTDGNYSPADHRPEDEEDRLGPDPERENDDDGDEDS